MRWYRRNRTPASFRVGFLIAGVQKAGTSTLFQLLRQQAEIGMSTTKEIHFFDDDTVNWAKPAYDRYHRYFAIEPGKAIFGEATPIYIFWPNALERIKAYNPEIKLILLFRDPIDRAYSAWCHQTRKGRENLSFAEAIRDGRRRVSDGSDFSSRHFSYVERGLYALQLGRAFTQFPRTNVLSLDSRQLVAGPSCLLQSVSEFLGLRTAIERITPPHANRRSSDVRLLPPSADDVRLLAQVFAPQLESFAKLVHFSIDHWLTLRLLSGTASAEELAEELAQPGFGKAEMGRQERPRLELGAMKPRRG
jgi:hypothetical protein